MLGHVGCITAKFDITSLRSLETLYLCGGTELTLSRLPSGLHKVADMVILVAEHISINFVFVWRRNAGEQMSTWV